ncbi:MAG: CBS domain-containing protein [Bdellovibrionales bacterium]|nr:CBS domain-containing protein [Bdellovibrionales bacterium]
MAEKTTARDIMSSKLVVARDDMNLEEAVKLLVNNKITGLPVVDRSGKMIGILSEYDIIAHVGKEKTVTADLFKTGIKYSAIVEAVSDDTPLEDILNKFIQLKCRRLPVIDGAGRLVGIISRRDIMRVLYYRAKLH